MQTTGVSPEQLTEELSAFLTTSMKSSQGEVFRIVEDLDLTFTQIKLLFVVDGADQELTPSELARQLGLSPAATGRAIDGMARAGLVARREDDQDRRVKRISLTAVGQDAANRVATARREGLDRLVAQLEPEQRAALSAALAPLLAPPCSPEA